MMEERTNIAQQVQSIIDKRADRLVQIRSCLDHLNSVSNMIELLERTRSEMVNEQGEPLLHGRFGKMLADSPGLAGMINCLSLANCRNAVGVARQKLADYELRSKRDGVYISVVGLARTGKSAILQGFSGLNSNVIPSFDAEDCTGATSVIYNCPGQKTRAILTFKSRETMLALVQSYVDKLIGDPTNRYILHSFEDIRRLRTKAVDSGLEEVKRRIPAGSADILLLNYLTKIADSYDEWAPLAGRQGELVLDDEKEIITYVAQNNGKKQSDPQRRTYYKYLVVDTCRIECSFPAQDLGKIVLVDTIGLGDHAIGIADSMLRTVRDESDAVIMVINPTDSSGSGINSAVKKELYEPIEAACHGRNLREWLFFLINHVKNPKIGEDGHPLRAINTTHCKNARDTLQTSWSETMPSIVDAMDPNEMKDFLRMMLTDLMARLDSVDAVFHKAAADALEGVWREYAAIADQVSQISKTAVITNYQTNQLIQSLFDDTWKEIERTLNMFAMEWKENRNRPCVGLYDATKDILNAMRYGGKYIPTQEELEEDLKRGDLLGTWKNAMDSARTQIKNDFLASNSELNKYITRMKTSVANVLYDKLRLSKLSEMQAGQTPIEWLHAFSEDKLTGYPHLQFAVEALLEFDFSVKGFLTYEVREALCQLDPSLQAMPNVVSPMFKRTAINIYDELDRRMVAASQELQAAIRSLCIKPSRALSAEVEDFVDRMLRAPKIRLEWNQFFLAEAGVFWAQELAQNQQGAAVNQAWNDLTQKVRQCNVHAKFMLDK